MYPYKLQKCQLLSEATKQKRLQRSKALLRRHKDGTLRNIIFSDEKLFTVEAIPGNAKKIMKTQKAASLMVWAAVSLEGRSPLIFIASGVKINRDVYIQEILEAGLIPWTDQQYPDGDWTFQPDAATFHTANVTQQWCKEHCPRFVTKKEWTSSSLDLNAFDYCVVNLRDQSLRCPCKVFRYFKSKTRESMG